MSSRQWLLLVLATAHPSICHSSDDSDVSDDSALQRSGIMPADPTVDFDDVVDEGVESRDGNSRQKVVTLPLTTDNVFALLVILLLAVIGCVYLYKLITRKACTCPLCRSVYELGDVLEAGSFGTVYVCHKDLQEFVLKKIPVESIEDANEAHEEGRRLQGLKHTNIVRYYDDFLHTEYGLEPIMFVCIVMEYCRNGDLHSRIIETSSRNKPISEKQMLKWTMQICSAMQYLHHRNMLHRDIKSANVFLTKKGNVRIGDLGLARKAKGTAGMTKCGTDCYMAPEMISGNAYGKKADVWSCGCVFFEMMTGIFMSELAGNPGAMVLSNEGFVGSMLKQIPSRYNRGVVDLIRSMLQTDPNKRHSIDDVIQELQYLCDVAGLEDPSFPRSRSSSNAGIPTLPQLSERSGLARSAAGGHNKGNVRKSSSGYHRGGDKGKKASATKDQKDQKDQGVDKGNTKKPARGGRRSKQRAASVASATPSSA